MLLISTNERLWPRSVALLADFKVCRKVPELRVSGIEIFVTLIFNYPIDGLWATKTGHKKYIVFTVQWFFVTWVAHEKYVSNGRARAGKIAPNWPSNKQVCWPRCAWPLPRSPPEEPPLFGPHFPAAWLIGCVILNAERQLKWIAVSSLPGESAAASGVFRACFLSFYFLWWLCCEGVAGKGAFGQLVVLSMGLTHNRCSNFIAFPPPVQLCTLCSFMFFLHFCRINFTLGGRNAIQSGIKTSYRTSRVYLCGKNSCRQLQLIAASCKNKDSSGLRQGRLVWLVCGRRRLRGECCAVGHHKNIMGRRAKTNKSQQITGEKINTQKSEGFSTKKFINLAKNSVGISVGICQKHLPTRITKSNVCLKY